MIPKFFYLFPILAAVFFGYWMGEGRTSKDETASSEATFHPEIDFPVTEEKQFAAVVYSYKNAKVSERVLKSIFEQEYDHFRVIFFDDASQDGTFEKVQSFVLEN